ADAAVGVGGEANGTVRFDGDVDHDVADDDDRMLHGADGGHVLSGNVFGAPRPRTCTPEAGKRAVPGAGGSFFRKAKSGSTITTQATEGHCPCLVLSSLTDCGPARSPPPWWRAAFR